MVLECENYNDVEIIVGTYEEFVLGFKPLKAEDGKVNLSQSFANHAHRASVRCVASGGRFMASGGADDNIQLYDMKLRKEMGVLMHHDKTVTCLAFAGTSHLLSGSEDGQVAIWRTGSWQCEKLLTAHNDSGVTAIAVHPSGKLCLTVGKDQSLKTWNLVKGRPAYTTNLHAQGEDVAFSESGDLYAVLKLLKGGAKFAVDVYGIQVAGVVYSLVPESRPSCVIFLEGDLIGIGTDSGSVELHRTSTKSCVCKFEAQKSRVRQIRAVKFSSGEVWIVVAASNGDISVWSFKKKMLEEKNVAAPKLIGTTSCGCRLTSMVLVTAPAGAVEPKIKDEDLDESKVIIPDIKTTPSKKGVVTIELEGSDDEDQKPKVKKIKKSKSDLKLKGKGGGKVLKAKTKGKRKVITSKK